MLTSMFEKIPNTPALKGGGAALVLFGLVCELNRSDPSAQLDQLRPPDPNNLGAKELIDEDGGGILAVTRNRGPLGAAESMLHVGIMGPQIRFDELEREIRKILEMDEDDFNPSLTQSLSITSPNLVQLTNLASIVSYSASDSESFLNGLTWKLPHKARALFQHPLNPLALSLNLPFDELTDSPNALNTNAVAGTLNRLGISAGTTPVLPVEARLRGHYRRRQDSLPPYELDLVRSAAKDTDQLFKGAASLDLITHGRKDSPSSLGSTPNVRVVGEAIAHSWVSVLHEPAFPTRLLYVSYTNLTTKAKHAEGFALARLSKKALEKETKLPKLEKDRSIAKAVVTNPNWESRFRVQLLQILLKNWDYCFITLHNLLGFDAADNSTIFAPYDFDLSAVARKTNEKATAKVETTRDAILIETALRLALPVKDSSSKVNYQERFTHIQQIFSDYLARQERCLEVLRQAPLSEDRRIFLAERCHNFFDALLSVQEKFPDYQTFISKKDDDWFEIVSQQFPTLGEEYWSSRILITPALHEASSPEQFLSRLKKFPILVLNRYSMISELPNFMHMNPSASEIAEMKTLLKSWYTSPAIQPKQEAAAIVSPEDYRLIEELIPES